MYQPTRDQLLQWTNAVRDLYPEINFDDTESTRPCDGPQTPTVQSHSRQHGRRPDNGEQGGCTPSQSHRGTRIVFSQSSGSPSESSDSGTEPSPHHYNYTATPPPANVAIVAGTSLVETMHEHAPATTLAKSDGQMKYRCWEHGCDGRSFSSRSNFLRHVKEKSENRPMIACPNCGRLFTRASAKDLHLSTLSCWKQR